MRQISATLELFVVVGGAVVAGVGGTRMIASGIGQTFVAAVSLTAMALGRVLNAGKGKASPEITMIITITINPTSPSILSLFGPFLIPSKHQKQSFHQNKSFSQTIFKINGNVPVFRQNSLEAMVEALSRRVVRRENGAISVQISFRGIVFVTAVVMALVSRRQRALPSKGL